MATIEKRPGLSIIQQIRDLNEDAEKNEKTHMFEVKTTWLRQKLDAALNEAGVAANKAQEMANVIRIELFEATENIVKGENGYSAMLALDEMPKKLRMLEAREEKVRAQSVKLGQLALEAEKTKPEAYIPYHLVQDQILASLEARDAQENVLNMLKSAWVTKARRQYKQARAAQREADSKQEVSHVELTTGSTDRDEEQEEHEQEKEQEQPRKRKSDQRLRAAGYTHKRKARTTSGGAVIGKPRSPSPTSYRTLATLAAAAAAEALAGTTAETSVV